MLYTVGQPSITSEINAFVQNPKCGYPETLSITEVPWFVSHDKSSFSFTVPYMSVNDSVGAYSVRIRNSISVPNDATKVSSTPYEVDYTLKIYISPCAVKSYTQTRTVGIITYPISSPTLTSPSYLFSQSPDCDYSQTITVTGLPSFMTHNTATA